MYIVYIIYVTSLSFHGRLAIIFKTRIIITDINSLHEYNVVTTTLPAKVIVILWKMRKVC